MHCNLLCIKVYINWMYINKKIYCVLSCWTQILSVTMNWRQQKCFYTTFDTITPWFKIKLSHLWQCISEWPNTLFSSILLPPHHHPYISDEHINCSFTFMPWTKQFPKQTEEVSSHFHNNLFFVFVYSSSHIVVNTLNVSPFNFHIRLYKWKRLQDKEDSYFSLMCFGQPLRSLERKEDKSYSQKSFSKENNCHL